ncbi:MAG TPA: hypothetical protein VFL92_09505 [Sphingomonas sp.]|nr:hypothetical protein [Sphingomonas sp.]
MLKEWSDREPPRHPRLARALEFLAFVAMIGVAIGLAVGIWQAIAGLLS